MNINPVEITTCKHDRFSQKLIVAFDYMSNKVAVSSLLEYESTKMSEVHILYKDDVDKLIDVLQKMKKEFK